MSGAGEPGGKPAADPTMEDILASIRRILNEDEAEAAPAAATSPGPAPLMLTEEMMVDAPPAPVIAPAPVIVPAPVIMAQPEPEPEPELAPEPVPEPPPAPEVIATIMPDPEPAPPPPAANPDILVSALASAAAAASLSQLVKAVASERSAAVTRGGPSIEDVVREELRPLLKDWLDQHLPIMVERLVRAEIERVVGRALG